MPATPRQPPTVPDVVPLTRNTTDCVRVLSRLIAAGARFTESPRGYYCYTPDVCVVLPRTYTSSSSQIIHFHGLRIGSWDSTAKGTVEHFKLLTLMYEDPKRLLVVPLGGKVYDLDQRYGSADGFIALMERIHALTGESCSDLILSAHSAGYRPVTGILQSRATPVQMRRICLYDALYSSGTINPLNRWLADPKHSCYNIAPMSSSTYAASTQVKHPRYKLETDTHGQDHWGLVSQYWRQFTDG